MDIITIEKLEEWESLVRHTRLIKYWILIVLIFQEWVPNEKTPKQI